MTVKIFKYVSDNMPTTLLSVSGGSVFEECKLTAFGGGECVDMVIPSSVIPSLIKTLQTYTEENKHKREKGSAGFSFVEHSESKWEERCKSMGKEPYLDE